MDEGPKSGQRELAGVPWWTSWSGVPLVAGTVLALVQAVLWPRCTSMEGGTEEKEVSGCSGSHSPTMTSARAGGLRTLALALRAHSSLWQKPTFWKTSQAPKQGHPIQHKAQ